MTRAHALRLAAMSTVIAVSAVVPGALTARAASGASYATSAPSLSCKGIPHSYIYTAKKSKLANYYPTSLAVKVSTTVSLCISNLTATTQTVTFQGGPLATIASQKTATITCNLPNTATFSLSSNPKAALHLTCTA